ILSSHVVGAGGGGGGSAVKVAFTPMSAFIVTVQLMLVPEQADKPAAGAAVRVTVTADQPVNCEPAAGVAVRVTLVPSAYFPAVAVGAAVIEPTPVPVVVNVSVNCCAVKVAVTLLVPSIFTVQGLALPEQSPDQPVNREPEAGVAVRVTLAPSAYLPAVGVGTGVIEPAPIVVSHSVYCAVKVAVTLLIPSIFTVQGLTLPEQSPDQPVNSDPGPGVAVRVTLVPSAYLPPAGVGTGVIDPAPIVVHHSAYRAVKVAATV